MNNYFQAERFLGKSNQNIENTERDSTYHKRIQEEEEYHFTNYFKQIIWAECEGKVEKSGISIQTGNKIAKIDPSIADSTDKISAFVTLWSMKAHKNSYFRQK